MYTTAPVSLTLAEPRYKIFFSNIRAGTLRAFLSGRLSYMFGFSGPSMTVDTACSSSMVSIYQACRALASGDCRAAVAGGVNVITGPDVSQSLISIL